MTQTPAASPVIDVLALTPLQEGMFALAKLAADGHSDGIDVYTMQFLIDVTGPLDRASLRRAAHAMLDRHPNLRASFWDTDLPHPVQIIPAEVDLPWREVTATPDEFEAIARAERHTNFDLARGPLLRFVLLAPPDRGERRIVLTVHHLLMDGWAVAVFFDELVAHYTAFVTGSLPTLPEPRPYRDYIGWLSNQDTEAAVERWRGYLTPLRAASILATGRPPLGTALPERHEVALDVVDTDRLTGWARRNGLTLNTVLCFAWAVVLGRLTGRRDVAFGTVVSGRPQHLTGVETMVGLFINTVPVVVELRSGAAVVDICARLQRDGAQLRDLSYLSLSAVQRAAGHAIFDTLLVFENAPMSAAAGAGEGTRAPDGVRFRPVDAESLTHYPLTVVSYPPHDGRLTVMIEALPGALGEVTDTDVADRLLAVLRQLPDAGGVDDLDVLLPRERIRSAEPVSAHGVAVTIPELFSAAAREHPDGAALTFGGGGSDEAELHYGELDARSRRLAAALAARGVGREDRVAIALPRSPQAVIAILGVLRAGAAYVPIDIDLPAVRAESMLRQSDPKLIIDPDGYAELLSQPVPAGLEPVGPAGPDSAAYIIFTSGSTGEPKGVIGTHGAVTSYYADHHRRMHAPASGRLGRPLRIAHAWPLSFDASWQPLVGLFGGHTVHLFTAEEMADADAMITGIAEHRIDMIDTSPSMFAQLSAAGLLGDHSADGHRLSVLALGGEAIAPDLWHRLRAAAAHGLAVHNCYGPTETTVEAVVAAVGEPRGEIPVIGEAVTGMAARVLDAALREVPDGVAGELYLAGAQLARGYRDRPGETAARFVADPLGRAGARMYRTGDLVRRRTDGRLVYLGRADDQIKVRGHRIEIAEVQAGLARVTGVREAAVLPAERGAGTALIGFVTPADPELNPVRVRAELAETLPAYMTPGRIVVVDDMPLTANRKLDTRALLDRAALQPGRAPATATERKLAEVFAEILGSAPDVEEGLANMGVDSILALAAVRLARRRGIAVRPRLILTCATIADLALAVDTESASGVPSQPVADGDSAPLPLLPAGRWLYERGSPRRLSHTEAITLPTGLSIGRVRDALNAVVAAHEVLRTRLERNTLTLTPAGPQHRVELTEVRLDSDDPDLLRAAATERGRQLIEGLDPEAGVLLGAAVLITPTGPHTLLLTVHVLAADPASWQVILTELAEQFADPSAPPAEHTAYRSWARLLADRAARLTADRTATAFWAAQLDGADPPLGARRLRPTDRAAALSVSTTILDAGGTAAVLNATHPVPDVLAAALARTITAWRAERAQATPVPLLALETHGRADIALAQVDPTVDTSATVGLLTAIYPLRIPDPRPEAVTAQRASIPGEGIDFALLRDDASATAILRAHPGPQVLLNYLGRADLVAAMVPGDLLGGLPAVPEPDLAVRHELTVLAAIMAGLPEDPRPRLGLQWRTLPDVLAPADVHRLQELFAEHISAVTVGARG